MAKIIYLDEWRKKKEQEQKDAEIRARLKAARRDFLFRHHSWY
jgi:hypothetical protein